MAYYHSTSRESGELWEPRTSSTVYQKQVGVVGCTVLILHATPPTRNHTPVYVDVGSKKGESSLARITHGPCLNGYSISHCPEQGTDMGIYTQSQSVMNSVGVSRLLQR